MRRPVHWLLVPLLLLAGACSADGDAPDGDMPEPAPAAGGVALPACTTLRTPPHARPTSAPTATAAARPPRATPAGPARALPDLALPCFSDGQPLRLSDVRGPAVLNFWASWCPPCREELPAVQRYAVRTAGTVHVAGVVTRDSRPAATSVIDDFGLTFPGLYDPEQQFLRALGQASLPVTVFVDGEGRVRHLHRGVALDDAGLARLAAEHLGVPVAA